MDKNSNFMVITPSMSDELADLIGTIIFQQKMLARLIEKRETGLDRYQGWHNTDCGDDWIERINKAVKEKRWVDVANLAMMLNLKPLVKFEQTRTK